MQYIVEHDVSNHWKVWIIGVDPLTPVDIIKLKLKVNLVIYIADRKATTCIQVKLFLLRFVNPQHYHW